MRDGRQERKGVSADSQEIPGSRFLIGSILVVLLLLAALYSIAKIYDYDLWWHLKAGEHIWKTFSIPFTDFFSFTTEGKAWIDVHWLAQLLFFLVEKVSGLTGIQILTCIVVIATILILLGVERKKSYMLFVLPLLFLAVYAAKDRFLPRPDVFTLFFSALFFFLLYRYKYHGERTIYAIPFLQILWVNMHGSFVLGPLLIIAFLAGDLSESIVLRFLPGEKEDEETSPRVRMHTRDIMKKKSLVFFMALLAALATSFINPYGARIYSLYSTYIGSFKEFLFASNPQVQAITIQEWIPTFSESALKYHHTFFVFYISITILCLASFIFNRRRFPASLFFTFMGFLFLSVFALRHVSVFSLIAASIAAINMSEFISHRIHRVGRGMIRKFRLVDICLLILMHFAFLCCYDAFSNGYYRRHAMPVETGFGVSSFPFPAGAAEFIKKEKIAGNIYNNFETGGFLIWALFPDHKVFTDGRYIDPSFDALYGDAAKNLQKWEMLIGRYGVETALLKYPATDTSLLIRELSASSSWKLVYIDLNSAVFMRDSDENRDIISRYEIPLPPFHERRFLSKEEIRLYSGSLIEKASSRFYVHPVDRLFRHLQRFIEKLQRKPVDVETLNKAYFCHLTGFLAASAEMYRTVLKNYPDHFPARFDLGLVLFQMEDYQNALKEMEYLLEKRIRNYGILSYAGISALHLGRLDEAERFILEAIEIEPASVEAHFNLGSLYLLKGEREKARRAFERCLSLDPSFRDAGEELEKLR